MEAGNASLYEAGQMGLARLEAPLSAFFLSKSRYFLKLLRSNLHTLKCTKSYVYSIENFNKYVMPHNHEPVENIEYFHLLELSLTLFLISSTHRAGSVFAYLFVYLFMFAALDIKPKI